MFKRKPSYAGSFYPSSPQELRSMIEKYLADADPVEVRGHIMGLVSPHAGYIYSGPVAAYSYAQMKKASPDLVVILAPSHRARFDGASIIPDGIYDTPLGGLDIDEETCAKIASSKVFAYTKDVHQLEHSLEVQTPFIRHVLNKVSIVPIIVGTVDLDTTELIAEKIYDALKDESRKFCILISTDLSHYHSYSQARELDSKFMDALSNFTPESIKSSLETGKSEACGEGPILAGVSLCRKLGAVKCEVLKYMNSGDTAGGKGEVVGYLSAAFVK